MLHIGAELAVEHLHIARAIRMRAEILQRRRPPARGEALGPLRRQHVHRAVDADGENLFRRFQIHIGAVMQDERPEAAEIGNDGRLRFRMKPNLAGQRQEFQRRFKIDVIGVKGPRDGSALWLLLAAFRNLAQSADRARSGPAAA